MENVSVVCVGDSTVDRFFHLDHGEADLLYHHNEYEIAFKYGEKISIENYQKFFGGSAINTSVGFSKLGIRSCAATIVGEDTDGSDIYEFLKQNNVGCEYVIKEGETNQSALLIYKRERTIFSYHKERNYEKINLPQTSWIYLCSAGRGFEKMLPMIEKQLKTGTKIVINPGSEQLKDFDKLSNILSQGEVMFLNKEEAEMLFDESNIKKLLDRILETGVKIAVITDGSNGAYIANKDSTFHMGIAPSSPIDSTGAGDAFASAFTAAVANRKTIEESTKWGMLNSASVINKVGANTGLLSLQDIISKSLEIRSLRATKF